nr:hypothetical protein [Nocardia vinacea]
MTENTSGLNRLPRLANAAMTGTDLSAARRIQVGRRVEVEDCRDVFLVDEFLRRGKAGACRRADVLGDDANLASIQTAGRIDRIGPRVDNPRDVTRGGGESHEYVPMLPMAISPGDPPSLEAELPRAAADSVSAHVAMTVESR